MKALLLPGPGRAEIVVAPLPEPAAHEVRVKVAAVATCPQWDLHLNAGEPMFAGGRLDYPYTLGQPGHEMTGVVEAVGDAVHSLRVGQRVAAWRDAGHNRQGCYAEYVCFDAAHLLPLPEDLDDWQVASLELAMCVAASVLALRRMEPLEGCCAAVSGLGPAGLIAAQMLRAEGATRVIGIEPSAGRRDFALTAGLVDAATAPDDDAIPRRPGRGAAVDVAVDCCGYPDATRWLMDRVGRAVALFAVQRHDYTYALGHGGLHVIGYEGHYLEAAEYALERIVAGQLDLRPLITVELPLARYLEGVALLRSQEALKIGFRP